jgi:UTP--glucose-1-phosphate uridylyltransferase
MSDIKKVVILVAGYGTRFLPATKAQPKEMLPLVDKPVVQYLVEEAVQSGIKEVILVTGKNKRAIEDHFDRAGELESFLEARGKRGLAKMVKDVSSLAFFIYVRQKEPRGMIDAVLQARPLLNNKPAAVLSGDDIIDAKPPALAQLIRVYKKYRAPVVALRRIQLEKAHKYGIISGKQVAPRTWRITGSVEKPKPGKAPSDLMIISKYILTPDFFPYLGRVKPPVGGEVSIPPAIQKYVAAGGKFYGYEVKGDYYDCGDKLGYMQAAVNFGLRHPEIGREFRQYLLGKFKNLRT